MNRVAISAAMLSAAMLLSGSAHAMTIVQFDKMSDDDQDEYVADLVVGAEKVLDHDRATQVHTLFTVLKPGDKISDGMYDFEILLAKGRVADDLRKQKDPKARALEVEDSMALTLRKNGIEVPDSFFSVNVNFRPKHALKK